MDSARIEREAADWLARRDSGDWSDADAQALADWQNESTAHRVALIRLQATWQRADRLQALGAGVPRGQIPAPGSWNFSAFPDRGARAVTADDAELAPPHRANLKASNIASRVATAALVLLAVGSAGAGYFLTYDSSTYRSEIGAVKTVSLADGSTMILNTDTVIHVRLSKTSRRIDLDRGEAFFEVAHDSARPFVVSTAGEEVIAVGTQFSVFRRAADVRVVVTEGKVRVEEVKAGAGAGPATELPVGSIAQAGPSGVFVKHASTAEAEACTSWRSGYITLDDTELSVAAAEFNRYNKKQLVIGDPSIAGLRVGGNLRAANVDAFVRLLEEGFPVRAQDQGDRIVLTGLESRR